MPFLPLRPVRRRRVPGAPRALVGAAAGAILALAIAGCSAQPAEPTPGDAETDGGLAHVHGAHADPDTGKLLLASHHGLFDATREPAERIGPEVDLMGFTGDGNGTFYASGHPGPGVDLPNPVGLLKSTDGGETWDPLSRQGESDFHALTTTRDGIVGFDGELRTSADGTAWETVRNAPKPYALAGTPEGRVVLATTEDGLWRSEDGGASWSPPSGGPVLLTAAFVDARTVAGVAPDGAVYISDDSGETWAETGASGGQPAAVTGTRDDAGEVTVWVVEADGTFEEVRIP
ncbi:F510_1955 family glycosylhydrolase [Arthrobacter sp. KK5.5]|uniref:F510_1955 family glycosylhydrolase n=1 Tax=Arthrobacter sp. KK5.5 TaxID=3373084 RepID=UPI003EE4EF27